MKQIDPRKIKCVVFDFGSTLSSDPYFKISPPECPNWHAVIQEFIFGDKVLVKQWMSGSLKIFDIASIIATKVGLPVPIIVDMMEKGCENLVFNEVVWKFALSQRDQGRKTALVTANMDVFTKVVVPSHALSQVFDVILNTSDYKELRKEILWPVAFEMLGEGIHYDNSLLIEDGPKEPALFRAQGGYAYQYHNDEQLAQWLRSAGFNSL